MRVLVSISMFPRFTCGWHSGRCRGQGGADGGGGLVCCASIISEVTIRHGMSDGDGSWFCGVCGRRVLSCDRKVVCGLWGSWIPVGGLRVCERVQRDFRGVWMLLLLYVYVVADLLWGVKWGVSVCYEV